MNELSEQELRERASLVGVLGRSLQSEMVSFDACITYVRLLVEKRAWTHFLTVVNEEVTYPDTPEGFLDFITTPRINGLGTTPEQIESLIADGVNALQMLRDALLGGTKQP